LKARKNGKHRGTENTKAKPKAQYHQIDIWIILGKIGFEWFSAHAEGFLKAVGRKPSGGYLDSPGSLRCSAIICRLLGNATTSMSRFDGIGLKPKA
jgi:hypothetical protein